MELKVAQLDGTQVSLEEVRRRARSIGQTVKSQLLSIPARVGSILAAEEDPDRVEEILRGEITQALDALGNLPIPVASDGHGHA